MTAGPPRSIAVLDLDDELTLRSYTRDGRTVSLTGRESGKWNVTTEHSHVMLDLDRHTFQRIPGDDANDLPFDRVERIRTLDNLRVGESILATSAAQRCRRTTRWYRSTPVTSIEPIE